jgi:hypothetical protein
MRSSWTQSLQEDPLSRHPGVADWSRHTIDIDAESWRNHEAQQRTNKAKAPKKPTKT